MSLPNVWEQFIRNEPRPVTAREAVEMAESTSGQASVGIYDNRKLYEGEAVIYTSRHPDTGHEFEIKVTIKKGAK